MKGLVNLVASKYRKCCLVLIMVYQRIVSPYLGSRCRFHPTCSEYAYLAVEQYGVFYGILLTLRRLLKCHRWYRGDWYDPLITEREDVCGRK